MIYVFGGSDASQTLSSVERFNGTTWRAAPAMATPRYEMDAVLFRGLVYLVAGTQVLNQNPVASVAVFDGSVWSTAPPLPSNNMDNAPIVYKDKLLVIGGSDGSSASSHVLSYDGTTWSQGTPLLKSRWKHGAVVVSFP